MATLDDGQGFHQLLAAADLIEVNQNDFSSDKKSSQTNTGITLACKSSTWTMETPHSHDNNIFSLAQPQPQPPSLLSPIRTKHFRLTPPIPSDYSNPQHSPTVFSSAAATPHQHQNLNFNFSPPSALSQQTEIFTKQTKNRSRRPQKGYQRNQYVRTPTTRLPSSVLSPLSSSSNTYSPSHLRNRNKGKLSDFPVLPVFNELQDADIEGLDILELEVLAVSRHERMKDEYQRLYDEAMRKWHAGSS